MYSQYEIVKLAFPFSDIDVSKIRPAVIISANSFNKTGLVTLAMVTSSFKISLPFDTVIEDYISAGLPLKCQIRMKFHTVHENVVLASIGNLAAHDINNLNVSLIGLLTK